MGFSKVQGTMPQVNTALPAASSSISSWLGRTVVPLIEKHPILFPLALLIVINLIIVVTTCIILKIAGVGKNTNTKRPPTQSQKFAEFVADKNKKDREQEKFNKNEDIFHEKHVAPFLNQSIATSVKFTPKQRTRLNESDQIVINKLDAEQQKIDDDQKELNFQKIQLMNQKGSLTELQFKLKQCSLDNMQATLNTKQEVLSLAHATHQQNNNL